MKESISILEDLNVLILDFCHPKKALTEKTSFEELNMDSFDVVDFLLKVEEKYMITFDDEKILEIHTIQDVIDELDKSGKEELSNA